MALTLKSLCRDYGYLDTDTEQTALLELCLTSAVQYLFNADLRPPKPGEDEDPAYDLLALMITTHWYDHRGVTPIGTAPTGQFALGVDALICNHGRNVREGDTLAEAIAWARRDEE